MGVKKAVLFDNDGTVMDSDRMVLASWQHTFRTVTGKDADPEMIMRTFGEPLAETVRKFFGGTDEDVKRNVEIYRGYYPVGYGDEIGVFPGVRELLQALTDRGYKIGMVTSRARRTTLKGLEYHGLDKYFDCIITADDTAVHKPDPEPLLLALERMGVFPEEALFVGDTKFDMGCAHNAGVTSGMAGWSSAYKYGAALGPWKPDYVLTEPGKLIEILEGLG